jgi:UDP-N-acetylglucosamine 2-epimerase (non-hydrolysing)
MTALGHVWDRLAPAFVLVQGDTATVAAAALAASYRGIRVGHVEAGLRTYDKRNPFPEEINRRLVGTVADLHFAPTPGARENLLREGVPPETVFVTGNTVVDALRAASLDGPFDAAYLNRIDFAGRRVLLATAHRRENHGGPLRAICQALREVTAAAPGTEVVFPVHPNPNVRSLVYRALGGVPGIHLVEPVGYRDMLRLIERCYLILTDSGGIQEEAASFGKPVLILRQTTERPEVIEAGVGRLVGTDARRIVAECRRLLDDDAYAAMRAAENPFGDGLAARRIVDVLAASLAGVAPRPGPPVAPRYRGVPLGAGASWT